MTQSSLQTRCPNCQTRFRVTEEQLSVARGKVRCGNCLEVFNAIEHQVQVETPKAGKPAGTGAATNKPAGDKATESPTEPPVESGFSASDDADDQFVFADNPDEDATEGRYAGTKQTFDEEELSDSFRSIDERSGPAFEADDEFEKTDEVDESWAEAILSEETRAFPPREKPHPKTESKPEPESEPEPGPAFRKQPEQEPRPESDVEVEFPFGPEPEPEHARKPPQPTPSGPTPEFTLEGSDQPEQPFSPESFSAEPFIPEPFTPDPTYRDLGREPISVASHGSGGKLRTILWSLVILGLLGTLVAQVTWFQFDRLSAIPELRPFYEKGCELAGCELKPLVDVNQIQSRKLVVRTDPENRNLLIVDAVIINRAEFAQPFPAIALTFSNLNGDVVAQSVFPPEDYLAGEGRELENMPPDTPVRIAINIRDPGKDAVNYNIVFRAHGQ